MATTSSKPTDLSGDSRFSFTPTPIQTAQDAAAAYLRQEITEDEFRSAIAKYGVTEPWDLFKGTDVGAYDITVPDELLKAPVQPPLTVKERIEAANAKQETQTVPENEPLPEAITVTSN